MILKPVLCCLLLVAILVAPSFGQTVRVRLDDREYDVDLGFRAVGGPVAPPGDVTTLTVTRRAEGDRDAASLLWPQAEHAARYVIYRKMGLAEWARLTTVSAASVASPGGMAGYVDRDLGPGAAYQYRVRAMNDLDASALSPPAMAPPREQVTPLPTVSDRPRFDDCVDTAEVSVVGKEVAPGAILRLQGADFGDTLGILRVAGVQAPILGWHNREILFQVPPNASFTNRPVSMTITRGANRYYTGALFRIKNGP